MFQPRYLKYIFIPIGLFILFVFVAQAQTWTEPTMDPPDGNVNPPVKQWEIWTGAFGVNSYNSALNEIFIPTSTSGDNVEIRISNTGTDSGDLYWAIYNDETSNDLRIWSSNTNNILNLLQSNAIWIGGYSLNLNPGSVGYELDIAYNEADRFAIQSIFQADDIGDLQFAHIDGDGNERDIMTLDNTGNVGIGTIDPAVRLHVVGRFRLVDGTQALGLVLTSDASGNASWQVPGTPSAAGGWQEDGPNIVRLIQSTDSVGIGTASPVYKLDVTGQLRATGRSAFGPTTLIPGTEEAMLAVRPDNRSTETGLLISGVPAGDGGTNRLLNIDSTVGGEIMTVLSSGKVGIGTEAPNPTAAGSNLLHVNSTFGNAEIDISSEEGNHWSIYQNRINGPLIFWNTDADNVLTLADDGSPFTWGRVGINKIAPQYALDVFGIANISSNAYVGGNLGVGITAPTNKLHVVGNGLFTGNMQVNGTLQMGPTLSGDPGGYRFPNTDGTDGYVLKTDGSGVLSWQADNEGSGGALPIGTSGQTLRHNGADWITNSFLFNSGAGVGIGITGFPLIDLAIGDSDTGIDSISAGTLGFYSNNAEVMRFKPGGNVGFGGIDPGYDLHINKANQDVSLVLESEYVGLSNYASQIELRSKDPEAIPYIDFTQGWTGGNTPDYSGRIAYWSNDEFQIKQSANAPIEFWTNNGVSDGIRMSIEGSGYIGMGTDTPNRKLHIYQDSGAHNAEIEIQSVAGSGNWWGIYHDRTTDDLRFWQGGDLVTFKSNGDVGIGITPATKLHVNGNIRGNFVANDGTLCTINQVLVKDGSNNWICGDLGLSAILGISNDGGGLDITNVNKINVNTVDPVYTIQGERYATYMAGMTGVKEETTGLVKLKLNKKTGLASYTIDFNELEKESDLWLFAQTINYQENFDKLVVLLTPAFDGRVWYEEDDTAKTLTIMAEPNNNSQNYEVSYRLTGPRFDYEQWLNTTDSEFEGLNLDKFHTQ